MDDFHHLGGGVSYFGTLHTSSHTLPFPTSWRQLIVHSSAGDEQSLRSSFGCKRLVGWFAREEFAREKPKHHWVVPAASEGCKQCC